MSTTLETTTPRVSFPGMLKAELVRLRLRPVLWTALLAVLALAAIGPASAFFLARGSTPQIPPETALEQMTQGVLLTQLVLGVLGASIAAGRYSNGEMRTILVATPQRWPALAALATVVATLTFALMAVAGYAGYAVGRAILLADGHAATGLFDPTAIRVVLGAAGYLSAVTLVGLALGVLLRSTAAASTLVVVGVYLLPELAGYLIPATWFDRIGDYLPSTAGAEIYAVQASPDGLRPALAAAVLLAWTAAAIRGRRHSPGPTRRLDQ